MKRFESAGMPEPKLLYVNQDCCSKSHTEARNLFPKCKYMYLVVRLDIWHFMRRLASCVSSESAGAVNFQAYLLEGLVWWNEDRHVAAVVEHKKVHDYQLQCDVVAVATKLGVEPVVKPLYPAPYTGKGNHCFHF
ncbi:hypothetical protein ElyMa_001652500 [Elysia marginata]|uniref:Uncharacterized protein n=1 Tax=Elysia marginata TaxID=1093978 RepID=A0AAV4JMG1_9GAST|nr:hypothetical protein ElyMa_001652500 [Elysia marginata]